MGFQPTKVFGLIWHHPIVSLVVLLLFTPPLFPIVVYFSPLLISTALCVLAMISMQSDHEDIPDYSNDDFPFKRVWFEEVDVDGPTLNGEREPKRLKASSKDDSWFEKVKNWEGTGRAWVDSVISQEARKSLSLDDNAAVESTPIVPGTDPEGGKNALASAVVSEKNSILPVVECAPADVQISSNIAEIAILRDRSVAEENNFIPKKTPQNSVGNIKSGIETAVSSEVSLAVGLDRNLAEKVQMNVTTEGGIATGQNSVGDIKSGIETAVSSEVSLAVGLDRNLAEKVQMNVTTEGGIATGQNSVGDIKSGIETAVSSEVSSAIGVDRNLAVKVQTNGTTEGSSVVAPNSVGDIKSGTETAVSSGLTSAVGADRNHAEKVQTNVTMESGSAKTEAPPTEVKSAAELLAPLRQDQPSAAVALSEKLKVPLADIMSLLAGDGNENAPNDGPSGEKLPTSSETTTTSQEEDWSSSDVESPAPSTSVPSSAKKDDA